MKQLQFFEKNSSLKTAREEIDSLFRKKETVKLIKGNLILLGLCWVFFGLSFQFLPPKVPVLFSLPWGEGQLVQKPFFALLPGSITILFLLNLRLASISVKKDSLLALIMLWSQFLASLMATIAILRIILLLA